VQLEILQAAVSYVPVAISLNICRQAVDKLNIISESYSDNNEDERSRAGTLETLLEICLMYKRTLFQQREAQSLKEELLLVLCRFVAGHYPGIPAATIEFVVDVAACFVEGSSFLSTRERFICSLSMQTNMTTTQILRPTQSNNSPMLLARICRHTPLSSSFLVSRSGSMAGYML